MSSLPNFHTKAVEEVVARKKKAQDNSVRATSFLDELDGVLADALIVVSGGSTATPAVP